MASKTPSYLQPTASTARRAASSASTKRAQPYIRHRPPLTSVRAPQSTLGDDITRGESKIPAVESQAVPTTQPSHSHSAEDHAPLPGQIDDTLQIAAQVQSWLFMQSNLQETLASVRQRGQDSGDALTEAISGDSDIESLTARSEAEKLVLFLDDLAKAGTGTRLPQIVHQFLEHEKSWLQLQADLMQFVALLSQLPTPSHEDIQKLKVCLDEEASRVASLLTEVELWNNETGGVHHTLAQLYPVLRARSDNIKIASDIIECSIDSIRVCLRV
ncbi:hypothetical protein BJY52DRAFT_1236467 [Lactarius psammicola]|nr:hypothetical protein BJY52DRAFT_1236467 [Lactarius psammicola]